MPKAILTVIVALMITGQAQAFHSDFESQRLENLPTKVLENEARKVVANGGIYSERWGDASPYLRKISFELIRRSFSRYNTESWALYIAYRESGFNPGAVNSSSSCTGLAQISPIHNWVDFNKLKTDPAYAVSIFVTMSKGGSNTYPWHL